MALVFPRPAHLRSLELPVALGDPLAGRNDELFAGAAVDSLEHVVDLFAPFEHAADKPGKKLAHFGRRHRLDESESDRTKALGRDLVRPTQGFVCAGFGSPAGGLLTRSDEAVWTNSEAIDGAVRSPTATTLTLEDCPHD